MPEFQLNADRYGKHAYYKLDDFAKGYVEAMFFTNGDIGGDNETLLNDLGVEKLTRKAVKNIAAVCDRFTGTIMPDGCFLRQWLYRAYEATGYDDARAGRDFWFSRQGHGVGFWSRQADVLPLDIGTALDKVAKQMGEAYPEVARGWIYHR